jgi:hypothetical protein
VGKRIELVLERTNGSANAELEIVDVARCQRGAFTFAPSAAKFAKGTPSGKAAKRGAFVLLELII